MTTPNYSSAEGDAYHAARHKEFFDNPLLTRAMADFVRITHFADLKSGQRVLEIGAGLGTNLLGIKDIAKVVAVEPAKLARDHCASLGMETFASTEELPDGSTFDFVMLRHVIEHVQDPRKMLLDAKRLLSAGGKLIVALPIEPITTAPDPEDLDHHLYSWTRQTIFNLLSDCGYREIETRLNYRNGRKLLLPIYRLLGAKAYANALYALGRMRGLCEIIVEASV